MCYQTLDPTAEVYLEPSASSVTPTDSIEFSLHNRSDTTLKTNFFDWRVHKYVDGAWYYIRPNAPMPIPLMYIEPDDAHAWSLQVENEAVAHGLAIPNEISTDDIILHGLGEGYYSFRGRGRFDWDNDPAMAFATRFDVEGSPIELTPTDRVEATEWDGDTLVARAQVDDPEHDAMYTYTVERVSPPAEGALEVITEQVIRFDPVRDAMALSFLYDADRVRVEDYPSVEFVFGRWFDDTVTYQGTTFEIARMGRLAERYT